MLDYPAWKNGEFCQLKDLTISILDLGLIHCDATYDVIAVKNGDIVNIDKHMERFHSSSNAWRLPLEYTREQIVDMFKELINKAPQKDLLLWIGLTRGIPVTGNPRDLKSCEPNLFAYCKPYFNFNQQNKATVCLARHVRRVPDQCINQISKNFAWNDLTMAQWEAIDRGYDTAILTDPEGFVTEGPGFSVGFITHQGQVIAPRRNRLNGTVMTQIEEMCQKADKSFLFADFTPFDMYNDAAAMFLASTAGNVIEVTQFENYIFNEENPTLVWLQSVI